MKIKHANPYIHFNGAAAKAIQLYESALDAKTEGLMRYGDQPGACDPGAGHENLILHAALRIGEAVVMLNDQPPDHPAGSDGNVEIALDFAEPADQARAFEALAAGGKVVQPLQDMFWGARFGALTDAHGVHWMFNCQLTKP